MMDRRAGQLAADDRSQHLEPTSTHELLLRKHLALDQRAPQGIVRRASGPRQLQRRRRRDVRRIRNRIERREDGAASRAVRDQLVVVVEQERLGDTHRAAPVDQLARAGDDGALPRHYWAQEGHRELGRRHPLPRLHVGVDDRAQRRIADQREHACRDQAGGVREPGRCGHREARVPARCPRSSRARSDSPSASTGSARACRRPCARFPAAPGKSGPGIRPWRAPARSRVASPTADGGPPRSRRRSRRRDRARDRRAAAARCRPPAQRAARRRRRSRIWER